MPASGISQGIQPIVGFNYGAGNYDRVKQTFLKSTVFSVGVTSVIWVITEVFPAALINLFGSGEELLSIGIPALRINFIALIRQVAALVPFIYILPRFFGTIGIFYAQPISDLLATILSVVLIVLSFRKMPTDKTNFVSCENT